VHHYIESKNPEEVDEFNVRREKQVRRAADVKVGLYTLTPPDP
jgi:hypothetical protein